MGLLQDKVAVVTGGTRGIGLATVKVFLEHGAKVILLGSRAETVDKALEHLKTINPGYPVLGRSPNLSDPEQMRQTMDEAVSTWGKLDILVNNAGISQSTSLYDYTKQAFDNILDLNVTSVFVCSQAAARVMRREQSGVILMTSSLVGFYGQASGCGYPVSKFAVNGLTKSLARELGEDGIRVCAVAPGITATDMVDALPAEMVDRISRDIPLGRVGQPEEVANAFLFLASDLASYITGAVLHVDGAVQV